MLRDSVAGELISSEIEIRSGKGEDFADAPGQAARAAHPPVPARGRPGPRARSDRRPSLEPLAGAAHHRHAALPARRGGAQVRGLAQQHLQQPHPRGGARRRPRRGRVRHPAPGAARAARGVGQLGLGGGPLQRPPHRPHRDIHADVSPLRGAGSFRRLGRVRRLRRLPLRDQLDRRAHPDLVEHPAALLVRDGRAADHGCPVARRRVDGARGPRDGLHRTGCPRLRRRRASRLRSRAAHDRGEHVAGDPLRARRAHDRPALRERDSRSGLGRAAAGLDSSRPRRAAARSAPRRPSARCSTRATGHSDSGGRTRRASAQELYAGIVSETRDTYAPTAQPATR